MPHLCIRAQACDVDKTTERCTAWLVDFLKPDVPGLDAKTASAFLMPLIAEACQDNDLGQVLLQSRFVHLGAVAGKAAALLQPRNFQGKRTSELWELRCLFLHRVGCSVVALAKLHPDVAVERIMAKLNKKLRARAIKRISAVLVSRLP